MSKIGISKKTLQSNVKLEIELKAFRLESEFASGPRCFTEKAFRTLIST